MQESARDVFLAELDEVRENYGKDRNGSFSAWICENILGITSRDTIDEAVIDPNNNYGIDIFHVGENEDYEESYMCIARTIFSQDLNYKVTKKDIESLFDAIANLDIPPPDAQPEFQRKSAYFKQIGGRESRYQKRVILAVTGTIGKEAMQLYNDQNWRLVNLSVTKGPPIDFEILDLDRICLAVATQPTPNLTIKFESDVLQQSDAVTGKRSIIGYVNAKDMVKIVKSHKHTMFLENPREALGKTPTNRKILETLNDSDARKKFWKLNNGITATCDEFSLEEEYGPAHYTVKNFKIVNGRQTTFMLEQSKNPLDDVSILMTIHEALDAEERTMISGATNTQNAIKPVDLITNSREITNLTLECQRDYPDFYFERQTKGFKAESLSTRNHITKLRVMEKNSTARAYCAYKIDPNDAMKSDDDFFSQSNPYYNNVFKGRAIRDLIIPHILISMMTSLHAEWKHDEQHERDREIITKAIVKYYILNLIHNALHGLDASEQTLIEDDIIRRYKNLEKGDRLPEEFIRFAEVAYNNFMFCYNQSKISTWPDDVLEKYKLEPTIEPTPNQIMYQLKRRGRMILPVIIQQYKDLAKIFGNQIQQEFKALRSQS